MINVIKGIFHIKNRETGEFEPVVAIKGEKGDPADVATMDKYFTSEIGNAEDKVMTQKGVTDLHNKIVSGDTKVGKAKQADTATKATSADSATKATQDVNGKNIDKTYAKLTDTNGEVLSTNILDFAKSLIGNGQSANIVHRYMYITDEQWEEGNFDLPQGMTRYGYATFFVRFTKIVVWLWGGMGSDVWHNQYDGNAWKGWRRIIDSTNIGKQSVSHASTADRDNKGNDLHNYINKISFGGGTSSTNGKLIFETGNGGASQVQMKYADVTKGTDGIIKGTQSQDVTIKNGQITVTHATQANNAVHATNADSATKATNADHATNADKATQADNATQADRATQVPVSANSTANDWLDVWFSRGADKNNQAFNQRARQDTGKFRYNPGTDTLRVGNIDGNSATATKATQDRNGNVIDATYATIKGMTESFTAFQTDLEDGGIVPKKANTASFLSFNPVYTTQMVDGTAKVPMTYFTTNGVVYVVKIVTANETIVTWYVSMGNEKICRTGRYALRPLYNGTDYNFDLYDGDTWSNKNGTMTLYRVGSGL